MLQIRENICRFKYSIQHKSSLFYLKVIYLALISFVTPPICTVCVKTTHLLSPKNVSLLEKKTQSGKLSYHGEIW